MEHAHGGLTEQARLAGVVRDVRNRWRVKRALRGATLTLIAGFAVLSAAAYAMATVEYAPGPVLVVRVLALAAVVAAAVRWLVLPLRRNPADSEVALYVEEHAPALDGALMTAVDVAGPRRAGTATALSGALVARLVRSALERVGGVDDGRGIDAGDLTRSSAIFTGLVAAAVLTLILGPAALRYGMGVSLQPWKTASPAGLFTIGVTPGNATVAKGGDQLVTASLHGFDAARVELLVRTADSTVWTRLIMAPDSTGRYAFRLFNVGAPIEYAVDAAGVRSPTFRLSVVNRPYVKQLDLQYRYPAYTHLPPRDVPGTGDIAALAGTMVRIRVTPTVPTNSGRIVVDGGDTLQLAPTADGSLIAMMRVARPGFYHVELQSPNDRMMTGSLDYTIDVLSDRAPTVSFTKPGRDQRVLSVDEVYTEAKAEDDYGIARLDLVYSVNGGKERTVPLSTATTHALRDVTAGYTFMLEDDSLQPGDVVSYYARATDNNAVGSAQTATSDIYFLNVRPYDQEYRQNQERGGGGGGGQRGNDAGQLSEQERQIVAGTFNLSRDSVAYAPKDLRENLATLRLAQQKLREQTTALSGRLVQRGIAATDTGFHKIAALLNAAAPLMDSAEQRLSGGSPAPALPPEQRALAELQRAEAVFRDIQVAQGGGGGGGGGGGAGANAQDLADIFELNKDKLRNQYETVQRGQDQQQKQQQQADQQLDEVMEKLKQLAARQQQQDQRAQAKADSLSRMGQSGASSGGDQRQLAQQTEDAARQLERLAREQQSQPLADAARQMQNAADAMRRSAADGGQQGAAGAQQALQQLEQARRLLDRERAGRAQRDVQDALQTQQNLAAQQQRVAGEIARLGAADPSRQPAIRQSIAQGQQAMSDSVNSLTSRLDRMALDNRRDQPEAARAIAEASDTLKKHGTADRLGFLSHNAARTAPQPYLAQQQQPIGKDIADLGQQLQQANAAAGKQSDQQRQAEALDRMRDLVQGLQSVGERMQQAAGQSKGGTQPGAQPGRQGQSGAQAEANMQQGAGGQQAGSQGQQQGAQSGLARGGQQGNAAGMRGQGVGGGGGGAQPGGDTGAPRLTPGQAQQFSRELHQRLADADTLRGMLARQGVDLSELDRAMANLRDLNRPDVLAEPGAVAQLHAQVIEGMEAFEFALRRTLGAADQRVLLGRQGDVPPAFRALVEEYYRSIAKSRKPDR
jgi:Domain of unknown function (DUF4175)